ncbi:ABC transporter ATP-binding protein [Desulfosporosinus sp. FKB]|uniref:ABC transporter ATP-binding protein n=1 Tax=Desulfosporosinus sp. FKB TaxID=1969835 RepID=UPI000B4985F2|nr:ABC transporter ATP-binding protein [Desulfosporosinus sp. FKB]
MLSEALSVKEPLLEIQNLSKGFPIKQTIIDMIARKEQQVVRAVDNVSLVIMNGETVGLVGESGCGKSTFSKTLIRLYKPDSGRILFDGEDFAQLEGRKLRENRHKIQMVFQDPYSSLNPRQTVNAMLSEVLSVHKICAKSEREDKIEALLQMVGLNMNVGSRTPGEFSGGQRQRLGIARALALNPRFLIADEPVSALDVSIQAQVINLLAELQHKFHLTMLFISHDLRVVRYITNRVAVMYLGKIVEISPTEELFDCAYHPYSRILIKAVPVMDPRQRNRENAIEGELPSPINVPKGCCFHPRCPYAKDICHEQEPDMKATGFDRFVACHFPIRN